MLTARRLSATKKSSTGISAICEDATLKNSVLTTVLASAGLSTFEFDPGAGAELGDRPSRALRAERRRRPAQRRERCFLHPVGLDLLESLHSSSKFCRRMCLHVFTLHVSPKDNSRNVEINLDIQITSIRWKLRKLAQEISEACWREELRRPCGHRSL